MAARFRRMPRLELPQCSFEELGVSSGLVTKHNCDLLHQPHAEQPQPSDEREPTNQAS